MVTLYLLSALGVLVMLGVGKLVLDALLKPKGTQLGSGDSPARAAVGTAPAPRGAAHRVVTIAGGASLATRLREHANAAQDLGLRPFLEVGAVWCPPSRMFGEVLDDPRMSAALSGIYLIRAEVDDFATDPLAQQLGIAAVPVFFELDGEGQATGHSVNGGAWGADTVENMSRTMSAFFTGA